MAAKGSAPTGIPRETFASMVGERIRSNIIEGVLPPGSQLHEVELAASFGVSRGPVREALQRLIQEGLLRSEPHRGVFVPVMSDDDIVDIYVAREALETAAVRRITGTARAAVGLQVPGQGRPWHGGGGEGRGLEDRWRVATSTSTPHSSPPRTAPGSSGCSPRSSPRRGCASGVLTSGSDARDDLVQEHREISEMIRAEDTAGAIKVLTQHFDDAVVTLRSRLSEDSEGEKVG